MRLQTSVAIAFASMVLVVLTLVLFLGVVEGNDSSTKGDSAFLPKHPEVKASDKNSVPPSKGRDVQVNPKLSVYESPIANNSGKALVIAVMDIFGMHPHVKYISDSFAEAGFIAVVPDLFHDDWTAVPMDNWPPPNVGEVLGPFFARNGTWSQNKPDLLNTIKYYQDTYGVRKVGMYGFCWGGKMQVFSAGDPDFKEKLHALGLVHPSKVTTEDAKDVHMPALLLPSKDEPDMLPFMEVLKKNGVGSLSGHHRYDDMSHGFAGARSDFSDPKVRGNVEDVIQRLKGFFKKTLLE